MKMKFCMLNILLVLCLFAKKPGVNSINISDFIAQLGIVQGINDICGTLLSSNVISPRIDGIKFKLKTPCDDEEFDLNKLEDIVASSKFNRDKKLVLYISGWLIGLPGTGVEEVEMAYHCRNDSNFVAVDSSNVLNTLLKWSVFNTQDIGEIIGKGLVRLVEDKMYPLENIHIIGHSLGVHIAGNAGRYFKEITGKSIPRITGLDPANGCFNDGGNTGLQGGNAEFIDIIHTNPGVFGTKDTLGNVDFYVGGLNPIQNGCIIFGCSHIRACDYYAETVYPDNENNFLSYLCPSSDKVNVKSCSAPDAISMGYSVASDSEGIYYLEVNPKSLYGKNAVNKKLPSSCNVCNK